MKRPVILLVTTIAALYATHSARAADLFWDTNGATTGSANDGTHIWGVDDFWTTDSDGASATSAYVPGSDVFFSAGTNGTGPNSIAVSGVQSANSITFQEGTVTLNSTAPLAGGLSLGAGGVTLVNTLQGSATISTSLGAGVLLTASQSWTNNTTNRTLIANAIISGSATVGQTTTLTVVGTGGTGDMNLGAAGFGGINNGTNGGNLAIVKNGGAILFLGGSNSYTGGTVINGGTVIFGPGAGTVPAAGMVTINASGTLVANGSNGLTSVSAWLSSAKIATASNGVIGISTVTDDQPLNFTNYPNLFLGATRTGGGGSTYSGTLTPGATGYNLGGGAQTLTVTSVLDQPTSLLVGKSSTVALTADNTYSGLTTVSTGTLVANHANALGSPAAGTTVLSGATLAVGNGITTNASETVTIAGGGVGSIGALSAATGTGTSATWAGNVILGDASARIGANAGNTLTVTGAIQESGANIHLVVSGMGTNPGAQGTIILASSLNGYTGETRLVRGNLKIGVNNALPTTTVLDMHQANTMDPGTFDLNGFNQTISGLKRTLGNGVTNVTNSVGGDARTLTINQAANTIYGGGTAAAVITGNLALVKGGAGTLTLSSISGANTYSGGTTVTGGVLLGAIDGAFGTGNVSVLDTAVSLTIQTGVLNSIADTATLSLAGGGAFGTADNGFINLGTNVNESINSLVLGGIPQVPGTYGSTLSGAQFRSDEYFSGSGMVTVAIPEPGVGLVLLGSFGALLGLRRSRLRWI